MPPGGNDLFRPEVSREPGMRNQKDIKIGFVLRNNHWLGGRNYLRNLFEAIHALPGGDLRPIIFTGMETADASVGIPDLQVVRSSIFDVRGPAQFARSMVLRVTSRDKMLEKLLIKHGVSVLSHSDHLGVRPSAARAFLPIVGWIPDFQHVHLPEFFRAQELQDRDRAFMDLCLHCERLIVSSECARADLQTFAPQYAHKAVVLRFVASPAPLGNAANLPDLQRVYDFDGPYFLLPNQFWAHKNHRVVIRALQILKEQGEHVKILATGSKDDSRNPSFFASLMEYAKECKVLDTFRVLGTVPFDHLVGLMRHSIAFINPSRFEGWSTSVEEAKSMGKQILLSDIAVHREQAPERGIFFPAEDAEALAYAMATTRIEFDESRDTAMQELARNHFPARQREFGEKYKQIIVGLLSTRC